MQVLQWEVEWWQEQASSPDGGPLAGDLSLSWLGLAGEGGGEEEEEGEGEEEGEVEGGRGIQAGPGGGLTPRPRPRLQAKLWGFETGQAILHNYFMFLIAG